MTAPRKSAVVQTSTRRLRVYVGDVLEGTESGVDWSCTRRIRVEYVGRNVDGYAQPCVLCTTLGPGASCEREASWDLGLRDWQIVKRSKLRPGR